MSKSFIIHIHEVGKRSFGSIQKKVDESKNVLISVHMYLKNVKRGMSAIGDVDLFGTHLQQLYGTYTFAR